MCMLNPNMFVRRSFVYEFTCIYVYCIHKNMDVSKNDFVVAASHTHHGSPFCDSLYVHVYGVYIYLLLKERKNEGLSFAR